MTGLWPFRETFEHSNVCHTQEIRNFICTHAQHVENILISNLSLVGFQHGGPVLVARAHTTARAKALRLVLFTLVKNYPFN